MLKVKVETEEGTYYRNILVIDAHSHIGKDVDGAQNMNPGAPNGTFDFWSQTEGKIEQDWQLTGEKSIEIKSNGKDNILTYSFEKLPFVEKIFKELENIQSASFKGLYGNCVHQNFIDQAVVFPFQDIFRDKKPDALYRASNENVARFATRFPYSLRLIGYMRCHPFEGDKAVKEVDYGVSMGIRGLKLHPRSEGWIDKIESKEAVRVVAQAAKYSLPVIFDTRGKGSILAIGNLIKRTRSFLEANSPNLVPHLKCIIAHFAQGNVGDKEVYNTICQPNTWGDLSMLHGKGAENFFQDFRKWYLSNNMKTKIGKEWSELLLFASDFPYFGPNHAKGLAIPIMNKAFFDSGGTLNDVENILGMNQLKLLPEYNYPIVENNKVPELSSIIASNNPNVGSFDIAINAVAKLIDSRSLDISKMLFQFDGNYSNYKGEVLLETKAKEKNDQTINLVLLNLIQDKMTMLSTLTQNSSWKKFGFKYFNPEDREFFHSVFTNSQQAFDVNTAFQLIKQAY